MSPDADEQLEILLSLTPFMVTRYSRDLRYLFVSAAYARMLGRPVKDFTGRRLRDVLGDEDFRTLEPHITRVLEGHPVQFEWRVHPELGSHRDLSVVYAPETNGTGEVIGWVASMTDVTERNRAANALRESEERYAAIFGRSPYALALTRLSDGVIVAVNDAFLQLFDHTRENSIGRTSVELGISNDEGRAEVLAELERRGSVRELEITRTTRQGERRVLSVSLDRVIIGGESHVISTTRDITDHQRIEQTLRESEQRFQTLADGSPVLLWVNGPVGCEFVNRAYRDFVGVERDEEVRGYDWSRFVHPEDRDGYEDAYLHAFHGREPFTAEFRFRRADGEWRWMRSEATPRIGTEGFAGFVGATIDITDRKLADDALRDGDRRKSEFLAIMSHELRNPLAPIRTGLELLRITSDHSTVLERVRPILERQISHLSRLTDDLLDVSRITSGRVQLQRQPSALGELMQNAVETQRTSIEAAGLSLRLELPDERCLVNVDPTRFVQVLSNLINNAIKFTPAGGTVTLSAIVEPHTSPPTAVVSVIDTGIGITASALPTLFDLFVQGDRDRNTSGLGVGLALARQLVDLHGGRIEAASDGPGHGSRFTVSLPVLTQPPLSPPAPAKAPPRVSRRVLVIDDNRDAADTLALLVTTLGGVAQAAYDGEEGLRRAETFSPEVIFLDIGMPGMDGYETCRRLRARPCGQRAMIVALTGWGQERDRTQAFETGFDTHLTKPADPETLASLLANLADGTSSSDGSSLTTPA